MSAYCGGGYFMIKNLVFNGFLVTFVRNRMRHCRLMPCVTLMQKREDEVRNISMVVP